MRRGTQVALSDGRRGEVLGGPVPRFRASEPVLYVVKVPGPGLPLTLPRDRFRVLAEEDSHARR